MIWVTADHHFGHENIIAHCQRPFASAHEMNVYMTERWNAVVAPRDIVYHLGDFAFRDDPRRYLAQLNGRVHLIRGNHDQKTSPFVDVHDVLYLRWEGYRFWLSHYPHLSWRGSGNGCIHLHGHSHGKIPATHNRFDVGVDVHGYTPRPLKHFIREQSG
jgi:calcineurin-like phosphoesterase family protein